MISTISDTQGRELMKYANGEFAVTRFPDMDDKTKKFLITCYNEFTNAKDPSIIKDFLDFKNDEIEFCS
jgi:hypothetical protein